MLEDVVYVQVIKLKNTKGDFEAKNQYLKNVVFNEKSRKTGNFKNRAFFGIYYIKYHFCSNERYHIRYLIMVLLIDASFLGKN